jgi:hypothetical protein
VQLTVPEEKEAVTVYPPVCPIITELIFIEEPVLLKLFGPAHV